MGNEKKTPVTINEKEYFYEDLTQDQQMLVQHLNDLDRKIGSAKFNLDQLAVGRQAFVAMLVESVTKAEEAPAEATPAE